MEVRSGAAAVKLKAGGFSADGWCCITRWLPAAEPLLVPLKPHQLKCIVLLFFDLSASGDLPRICCVLPPHSH